MFMQHSFDTIRRKIQMGGQVLPAEIVLCVREILVQLENIQERLNGLEASTKSGQGTSSVSKGKVSKSKVQSDSDK
tara:strand:+ start:341 stop:568 length:228 start_codon:yes stop_codon:yes gene_type:complete